MFPAHLYTNGRTENMCGCIRKGGRPVMLLTQYPSSTRPVLPPTPSMTYKAKKTTKIYGKM